MKQCSKTDYAAVREAIDDLEGLSESAAGGVEGLDRASCSPKIKYLAQIGFGAAVRGCSRDGWREEVAHIAGLYTIHELDVAEDCMRHSGLWPWP